MTRDYLALAQDAFENGFASKAAQKRALDNLNRAYHAAHGRAMNAILDARVDVVSPDYWDLTSDLHLVRDRHVEMFTRWTYDADLVRGLVDLRAAIKAAPIAAAVVNETRGRVETIRRSIVEEMTARGAKYVRALEVGRQFGGLPVSVNAHWVHGHKGAVFIRYFFYLRGELTPLNIIMAAASTLERESKA